MQAQAAAKSQEDLLEDMDVHKSLAPYGKTGRSSSGFGGLLKGERPGRFNEDLDSQSGSQTISMKDFIANNKNPQQERESSKKIKVNLRSVNNPAEREKFRKLLKNRTTNQSMINGLK